MSNMVVRTNVFALNAHRNMKNVGLEQRRASNRLSSGYRINSAADDAAGLAISETMRAQIRGLDQASRNTQDGQAMILTTEGGLEEIGNMLQRTRELLVQASNDTNTQDQRHMIEQEINQLSQEIGSMQQRVEFNTNRVLAQGPAMSQAINESMADLQADGRRVSFAFNALDANRSLVNEAREMLSTLEGTADRSILNTRQTELLNNALDHVWLTSSTLGGSSNNVATPIPNNIIGVSAEYMGANVALAEVTRLLENYDDARGEVIEFRKGEQAALSTANAIRDQVGSIFGYASGALSLEDMLADTDYGNFSAADAGRLNTILTAILASAPGEADISAFATDADIASLDRFMNSAAVLADNSAIATAPGAIIDAASRALDALVVYSGARIELTRNGFGPQPPDSVNHATALTEARSARTELTNALSDYRVARGPAAIAGVGTAAYDDYVAARETLGTALGAVGGPAFQPAPVTLTQYIGFLNTRATDISDRARSLNATRNEMTVEANAINETISDWRNAPTTGNYIAFFQVGANANQGISFDFENVSRAVSAAAAVVRVADIMVANPETGGGIGRGVEISPLINSIQSSLDDINRVRANLGAVQNRMDYTMRSLDISSENLSDSESRVRNADVAREMMRFTMANVLQQASVSMLSQANQMPQNLLQLLR